jgi:opacity protein-like surface antigen
MKPNRYLKSTVKTIAMSFAFASILVAQPASAPLDIQGLDQFTINGIRSRAMGGTSIANANDASALFSNPAALSRITSFEVRSSALFGNTKRQQTQEWVAFRPLPGLSVLFEGLTRTISPPRDTTLGHWDRLQTQYDNIDPNWDKSASKDGFQSLAAAMPFQIADMDVALGVGVSQVIDLGHYYQNNNSMTPYLGQQRPDPFLITQGANVETLHVKWYQYMRKREGSVYGITPGLSFMPFPGLRLGGSATFLTGSSDDKEYRVERGHVNIAIERGTPQDFMLDTVYYSQAKVGTSTYKGNIFTFGVHFEQSRYSIGITVRPPMTLTRSWQRNVTSIDTTRKSFPVRVDSLTTRTYSESGTDDLKFPLAFSLGVMLTPTDRWTIAFDYELRQLSEATLTTTFKTGSSRPWANSKGTIRLGAEFRASDMLALRGGFRDDIQAFSPDGSAIIGEPARGGIYSVGGGFTLGNVLIDLAYEYARLKYQDIYQSNVNYNTQERHQFMTEIAYRF